MLTPISQLYKRPLQASDGEIGYVKDAYFDDQSRMITYILAETGSWMQGRQVLILPQAFDSLHSNEGSLKVNLTKKQIEDSPPMEAHKPVSRQYEEKYHQYYGKPCYWLGLKSLGVTSFPVSELPSPPFAKEGFDANGERLTGPDDHLRSAQTLNGYQVEGQGGLMGTVCDLLFDPDTLIIDQLIFAFGNRWQNKQFSIPASLVTRISYEKSRVYANISEDGATELLQDNPTRKQGQVTAV